MSRPLWTARLFGHLLGTSRSLEQRRTLRPPAAVHRLRLEALEDRQAPATLTVNSTADTASPTDPYLSLREAIAIVNGPTLPSGLSAAILGQISGTLHQDGTDRITFDPGKVSQPILLTRTQLNLSLPGTTASITIDDGAAGVTLDANHSTRILEVAAGVVATLNHLTITHGIAPYEGSGYGGGGISNQGTLTISNSTVASNSSYAEGGGIYNNGTLTISNSTLASNSTGQGGGIYNEGTLTVTDSTLRSNTAVVVAAPKPGGIGAGGGIRNFGGTVTLSNSTLAANVSDDGGGIVNNGTMTVTNCTFTANSARVDGGALYNSSGTLTVSSSTVSGNSAGSVGGIVTLTYGTQTILRLENTIVAGNRDSNPNSNDSPDLSGTGAGQGVDSASSYNLIGIDANPVSVLRNADNHNRVGSGADPLFARLAPVGSYGGPTQTLALLPGSPALGSGDPGLAGTSDQRGVMRASGVDIGASQATVNSLPSASIGVFDPTTGFFYLRDSIGPGAPDAGVFPFGLPNWKPLAGNWFGPGPATPGVFDPATATFYLRTSNDPTNPAVLALSFGLPNWLPVAGDWDGTGTQEIGIFDPTTATFYLRGSNDPKDSRVRTIQFGVPGWLPLAGDWNNTGAWSVGAFDPSSATFYLRESTYLTDKHVTVFQYGAPGWLPVTGRWEGQNWGIGVVDPSTETWYIRFAIGSGAPSVTPFTYGAPGWTPLAGNWSNAGIAARSMSAGDSTDLAESLIHVQKKQDESDQVSEL